MDKRARSGGDTANHGRASRVARAGVEYVTLTLIDGLAPRRNSAHDRFGETLTRDGAESAVARQRIANAGRRSIWGSDACEWQAGRYWFYLQRPRQLGADHVSVPGRAS